MGKKKPQGTLAAKLAPMKEKMAAEEATLKSDQKAAKQRKEQEAVRRAAEDDEDLTDEERFARAVTGMKPQEKSKKFDVATTLKDLPPPPKVNDEEAFLKAMTGLGPGKEGPGKG